MRKRKRYWFECKCKEVKSKTEKARGNEHGLLDTGGCGMRRRRTRKRKKKNPKRCG